MTNTKQNEDSAMIQDLANAVKLVRSCSGDIPEPTEDTTRLHCVLPRQCEGWTEHMVCRFYDANVRACRFGLGQLAVDGVLDVRSLQECPMDGSIRVRDAFLRGE